MRNLTEAVNRVKIETFMPGRDEQMQTLNDLVQNLIDNSLNDAVDDENIFRENWAAIKKNIGDHLFEEYCYFKKAGEVESEMWRFWNIFTDEVMPLLIDMTQSFREANWTLNLQAIRKAIPLFFYCNRTN